MVLVLVTTEELYRFLYTEETGFGYQVLSVHLNRCSPLGYDLFVALWGTFNHNDIGDSPFCQLLQSRGITVASIHDNSLQLDFAFLKQIKKLLHSVLVYQATAIDIKSDRLSICGDSKAVADNVYILSRFSLSFFS